MWGEAASTSLRGPPSLWLRRDMKRRDLEVSNRRHRKKSIVREGNLRANLRTGSRNGLPSCGGGASINHTHLCMYRHTYIYLATPTYT